MIKRLITLVPPLSLQEEFAGVVTQVESLRDFVRGRISAFEPRSRRGRWMGCLRVCWHNPLENNYAEKTNHSDRNSGRSAKTD